MGRKNRFITTDQQRFDSLGCNGGTIAQTPVVDGLAAGGINYGRADNQNTACMPDTASLLGHQPEWHRRRTESDQAWPSDEFLKRGN